MRITENIRSADGKLKRGVRDQAIQHGVFFDVESHQADEKIHWAKNWYNLNDRGGYLGGSDGSFTNREKFLESLDSLDLSTDPQLDELRRELREMVRTAESHPRGEPYYNMRITEDIRSADGKLKRGVRDQAIQHVVDVESDLKPYVVAVESYQADEKIRWTKNWSNIHDRGGAWTGPGGLFTNREKFLESLDSLDLSTDPQLDKLRRELREMVRTADPRGESSMRITEDIEIADGKLKRGVRDQAIQHGVDVESRRP